MEYSGISGAIAIYVYSSIGSLYFIRFKLRNVFYCAKGKIIAERISEIENVN